jgi:hypothetical protein
MQVKSEITLSIRQHFKSAHGKLIVQNCLGVLSISHVIEARGDRCRAYAPD